MKTTSFAGVSLVLAAALLAPGTAGAATLYQCVNKQTGLARYVDPTSECLPSESSLILTIPEVVHGSVIDGNAYTAGARNFTYTRQQAGQYVVNFSALESTPDCVVDIIAPPVNEVAYCAQTNTTLSKSSVGIACFHYNPTTNTFGLFDANFTFVCVL